MGETTEHVDVLIVGAGISGIGCAYYLQRQHPQRSFAIVESRGAIGGTWDLFRYPGVRSDSDLHTFGFEFKPWESQYAIAGGPEILRYIHEAASENGLHEKIRLHHRVVSAAWSSQDARWTVEIERTDTEARTQITANWLFCGTGYYRYDSGYTPEFPGLQEYGGRLVHPQQWPEDLDYAGKRVVVIGSGATAVTLIPAMAETAAHVTMLQRSPTYILPLPSKDAVANALSRLLGPRRGYAWTRRKNIFQQAAIYRFCQRFPSRARKWIVGLTARQLPDGYPVDVHFNPPYNPWDQRLCIVPDGDLFKAIRKGTASVVTDQIATFTHDGIKLASGEELQADIVVTATGLRLLAFGGIEMSVDGEPVDFSKKIAFRGVMLDGIPNFAFVIGYTNASWTLKVGLVCEHFCRLLEHMDDIGADTCVVELPYPHMATRPLLGLTSGYVKRALDDLPRQGTQSPWELAMNVYGDTKVLREGPVTDRNIRFSRAAEAA
jgi:monooxygenase